MEPVEVKSGSADIIASGTAIAFNGHPIEITFGPKSNRLTLILILNDNKNDKESKFESNIVDDATLKLVFTNVNNPLGIGNISPVNIGELDGRELYLNTRIYSIEGIKDKTVHYNIYLLNEAMGEE